MNKNLTNIYFLFIICLKVSFICYKSAKIKQLLKKNALTDNCNTEHYLTKQERRHENLKTINGLKRLASRIAYPNDRHFGNGSVIS